MYTTRILSSLRKSQELVKSPPEEGPFSGFLVLFDVESEETNWFGKVKTSLKTLPFPQNLDLVVTQGDSRMEVLLVPVLDQPLSSNRYYVIHRQGRHKGKSIMSSKEENAQTCLCCLVIDDIEPKPLDPLDTYQQVEIIRVEHRGFTAVSVAPDGIPPDFLREKYWSVKMHRARDYRLGEALGLDSSLRARLPDLDFPPSSESSEPIVVGKWYCPFVFVKEHNVKLKKQMKLCCFYEMTLEQRWEKIFGCDNDTADGPRVVCVEALLCGEEVFVCGGNKAVRDKGNLERGFSWFRSCDDGQNEVKRVGLSIEIMERIKWEQERVGWVEVGYENKVKVERREEFEGKSVGWTKFGCYVLVERFVLKRMDKSIVLTYGFKHTHHIRCKWE